MSSHILHFIDIFLSFLDQLHRLLISMRIWLLKYLRISLERDRILIMIEVNKRNLGTPSSNPSKFLCAQAMYGVSIVTLQVPASQSQVCGILCS